MYLRALLDVRCAAHRGEEEAALRPRDSHWQEGVALVTSRVLHTSITPVALVHANRQPPFNNLATFQF